MSYGPLRGFCRRLPDHPLVPYGTSCARLYPKCRRPGFAQEERRPNRWTTPPSARPSTPTNPRFAKRNRHLPLVCPSLVRCFRRRRLLPEGGRWSTWDHPPAALHGPEPLAGLAVTRPGLGTTPTGILRLGKSSRLFLAPQSAAPKRSALARRQLYRSARHRCFHATAPTGRPQRPGSPGPPGQWPPARPLCRI